MGENKKTPIMIDDKEYDIESFNDEQKRMLNHIVDLDRKMESSEFNLEQLRFGRESFLTQLKKSLETEEQ
tara:strand:+ start:599 stop:808 length:210 start_codon:yes stop_codon:yes gene_type:complete